MQAIILAAGMGKRLKELTANNTKCVVKVNGISLIERALRALDKHALSKIVIVTGYKGAELKEFIGNFSLNTPIIYVDNPIYDKTNNIYSLALAKEYLVSEDTLLLESDLIFEESVIKDLIEDKRPSLALVDKFESWMDGTCMTLDDEDRIVDFIPGKHLKFDEKEKYYKTVNIYKFSKDFSESTYVPFLEAYSKAMGDNEYYESVIKLIAMLETNEIRAKRLNGQRWYEIDDVQDLDIAETLFPTSDEEQYHALCSRYGGYWRYPGLKDYCYLVNPYYPPRKMTEEMKANFEVLLTQYPSGMRVNSLLASKYFGVLQDRIVIGNGAAELINVLMKKLSGKVGVIRPTFEEYANRLPEENVVVMNAAAPDFNYNSADIIAYFSENHTDTILLINPDNPSGNFIEYENLIILLDWCAQNNICLVYDESFADFAKNRYTLLSNDILAKYGKNLIVIKSISKSFGVPGIRLGVMASADTDLISEMKKEVSIWNINSYGEFYMQIAEKYRKDYEASLNKIVRARDIFFEDLKKVSYLRPICSEANYIMCEVDKSMDVKKLCGLLLKKNFLIKDLSSKLSQYGQYIRIAVKSEEDNRKLTDALSELI